MKKTILFFVLVFALFFTQETKAQCAKNLAKAQAKFDDGHLYEIASLLEVCITKGTDQNKIAAYELLTITYLYIDDPLAARESFMSLLELEPEYRLDTTDYIELVHLSKEFITTPIVSWRARGGVNFNTVSTIYSNSTNNPTLNTENYSLAPGWSLIGSIDIHLNKVLSFSLESDLNYSSFIFSDSFYDKKGVQNSKNNISLHESSYNYSLPVSVRLICPSKKNILFPYVYGGYSPNYNFITTTNSTYVNNVGTAEITSEDKKIDLKTIRNSFSNSVFVGAGLMRKIKYQYVFIDVRYKMGLSNRLLREGQNDFDTNEEINKYLFTYQMIDNDFRQNEFNLTVGYVWPKYKARRRKSVTVKSFIGGMFKKKKDE